LVSPKKWLGGTFGRTRVHGPLQNFLVEKNGGRKRGKPDSRSSIKVDGCVWFGKREFVREGVGESLMRHRSKWSRERT